jgi:hypothetical protein
MSDADVIRDLGQMAFNMSYASFREALGETDDWYALEKYQALKTFARAMSPFTDSTLARLTAAYRKDIS